MRRLQYWHPALSPTVHVALVARDKQRAWGEWQADTFVYCLPELRAPERWRECPSPGGPATIGCLAIPAEHVERLTVFHIGSGGHVWGPMAPTIFKDGSVQGLLDAWLSLDSERGRLVVGTSPLSIELPCVEDGRLARSGNQLRVSRFRLEPAEASLVPARAVTEANGLRTLALSWPPDKSSPRTISPDAERLERLGSHEYVDVDGISGAMLPDGTWRPSIGLVWPEPFATLLGPCAGLDAWHALAHMRNIAALAATDGDQALAMAATALSPYVADAKAPLWLACLGPDVMASRDHGRDVATWERYGFKGRTLAAVLDDPASSAPVAVQRVWGGIGLLWALLVDRLEQAKRRSTCERCGHLLEGAKTFCGAGDNPECYRARRTEDQRKSRATRATHGKRPRTRSD